MALNAAVGPSSGKDLEVREFVTNQQINIPFLECLGHPRKR